MGVMPKKVSPECFIQLCHNFVNSLTAKRTISGLGHNCIVFIFLGSVAIPFFHMIWPKYVISDLKNSHLLSFNFKLALLSFLKMASNLSTCSSGVLEYIIISAIYIIHQFKYMYPKHFSIKHWNVAGAFVKPKGIQRHL